ncbi:H-NS family nucleoid-associated regulatory protein [Caballeronia sp. S22]|uniref:H-NS histone family protein n=1 Tax=Caballeronia sp. S22 TaxID=3137182 RepID=UPI0035315C8D
MTTLESIQARIKKLETQAQALKTKAASGVLKQIHDLMARHEISIDDVAGFFGKASGKTKANAVGQADSAKYVDPKTGATWSGRGRAPAWIANASDRTAFLAAGTSEATSRTKLSVKRRTAARKGPQPALYRDPVSGLTWSGFGRAPGWITSAKDRSAFLIDKGSVAGTSGAGTQAVAKKGPAAKKSASKAAAKPATKKAASPKTKAAKKGPAAKKQAAAKKGAAASKGAAAKKVASAKKVTASKKSAKSAATKSARSIGRAPARKSQAPAESVAPVESPAQNVATEAENLSL